MTRTRLALTALLLAALAPAAAYADGIQAITKPSEERTLSFARPGRIAEVVVKEGDLVKADQLLIRLDSREEEASLAIAKSDAENMTTIEVEEALVKQKEIDLKKTQWAREQGAKSQFELDEAKVALLVEQARLKLEKSKHDQSVLKMQQAQAALDKMFLRSPLDGRVEQILMKAGEAVEMNSKLVRVIVTDPLKIEVPVPLSQGRSLREGQKATVTYPDKTVVEGTISFAAADADAASETLRVTLKVPNPDNRKTGERVQVTFIPGQVAQQKP